MFSTNTVKLQVIAILGLAVRSTLGVPTYSTTLGDQTYATEEIDRAILNATSEIMMAISETDGHHHRPIFVDPQAITHEAVIPAHLGSPGVPRITPFSGASYTIVGKRKSIEEISAYRSNPNQLYSAVLHNASLNGIHSKLAGFYAIDKATNVVYFTGNSAVMDLAHFIESDFTLLPEMYHELAFALAIRHLKKDGDVSDVFDHYTRIGEMGLTAIRVKEADQPSARKTIGTRDSGTK